RATTGLSRESDVLVGDADLGSAEDQLAADPMAAAGAPGGRVAGGGRSSNRDAALRGATLAAVIAHDRTNRHHRVTVIAHDRPYRVTVIADDRSDRMTMVTDDRLTMIAHDRRRLIIGGLGCRGGSGCDQREAGGADNREERVCKLRHGTAPEF